MTDSWPDWLWGRLQRLPDGWLTFPNERFDWCLQNKQPMAAFPHSNPCLARPGFPRTRRTKRMHASGHALIITLNSYKHETEPSLRLWQQTNMQKICDRPTFCQSSFSFQDVHIACWGCAISKPPTVVLTNKRNDWRPSDGRLSSCSRRRFYTAQLASTAPRLPPKHSLHSHGKSWKQLTFQSLWSVLFPPRHFVSLW
jgi:hypothetical protein